MNKFIKIELLKYTRHFICNGKIEIAKSFINQLIRKAKVKSELITFKEMLNCLNKNNNIYYELVIERIDEIIRKELSNSPQMDNSMIIDA